MPMIRRKREPSQLRAPAFEPDVTLATKPLTTPEDRTTLINKFSNFKPTAMAAPFLSAFAEQAKLQSEYKEPAGAQQMDQPPTKKGELKTVKYREEEAIFIQASNDRVTIIFSTVFKEETDREYGRLFLQVSIRLRSWKELLAPSYSDHTFL
jgi:actin related protein 2/3 complex subunit 2